MQKSRMKAKAAILMLAFALVFSGCSSLVPPKKKSHPDFLPGYLWRSKKARTKYYNAYNRTLKLFGTKIEEIDLETRYGKAHVIAGGPKNGMPLLLLHGMDASSTMWYPNFKDLCKTHRVYAVDYIMDVGKSELKTDPLNNDEVVLFYSDVVDGLKIKQYDLLGTSRGGWIAAYIAMQPGNKVRRLVLMSPAQVLSMVDFKIFPAMMYRMFPSRKKLRKTIKVFAQHPEKIAKAYTDQFYIGSKYGYSEAQVTKMMPFGKEELERLEVPVLLMVGDHDIMNDEASVEKAKKYIKNLTVVWIADAGHFMSTDQSETVDQKVLEFLK